jgi:hypothetical protein
VHTGTSISDGTTLMARIDRDAALTPCMTGRSPSAAGNSASSSSPLASPKAFPSRCATPPRPGQPEPETPDHSHPPRSRTTPPALASHHLSRPGHPSRAC